MEPETIESCLKRQIEAKRLLWPDFVSLGDWKFLHIDNGNIYDLSAADLTQIDLIVDIGLFVVK